ncbi:related to ATP-dependent RNA helicase [Cephalotrichum gorgonifer]|uniref:RNA helicase n=1 Tax=Cephalotrichum gorgonifer TaxID=2041049 RepID=A0AAE8SRC3_9PEZI|nr:related to ATP-dependent RNA helicase [Cephalotrichum gorgonifer]
MSDEPRPQKKRKLQGQDRSSGGATSATAPLLPKQTGGFGALKNGKTPNQPKQELDNGTVKRNRDKGNNFRTKWMDDPKLLKARKELPIWAYRSRIQESLRRSDTLIIVGETGSGKSTQIPQFLHSEPWCQGQVRPVQVEEGEPKREVQIGGMIAVTQPRRVAATTLAHRVAQEAGCPLKKSASGLVGYSVRFDRYVPKGAKIKFLTEGMLLQELLRDPHLRQYSAVIVDEIHERSIDVDLVSGFLKKIQSSDLEGRGGIPLKVVIMSATADVDRIRDFFTLPLAALMSRPGKDLSVTDEAATTRTQTVEDLHIEGRQFPVKIIHSPKPVPVLQEAVVDAVLKLHQEEPLPGGILAFLAGQDDIESVQSLIRAQAAALPSNVPKIKIFPLYGQLSMEAQHAAFQPINEPFTRKIVLATNIAETSVTVPGIRYVVDNGKSKVKEFRPLLGLETLLPKPISQSSAIQRSGRAGREGPGKCIRLYTEDSFSKLAERDVPEILRNEVLGAILTMAAWGINDINTFPLMERPDIRAVLDAQGHLIDIGATDRKGAITESGRKLASFPISPSLGAVLLAAAEPQFDCVLEVIDIIAAITSGDDIFIRVPSDDEYEEVHELRKQLIRREGDLLTYLTTMQQYTAEHADRLAWCRSRWVNAGNMKTALSVRRQLRGLARREGLIAEFPPPDPQPYEPMSPERAEGLLKCFLRGFLAKTALMQPNMSYETPRKGAVSIHPASVLHGVKREAIMFLDHVYTQKSYAKRVSVIQAVWIQDELMRLEGIDGRGA